MWYVEIADTDYTYLAYQCQTRALATRLALAHKAPFSMRKENAPRCYPIVDGERVSNMVACKGHLAIYHD